MSALCLLLLCAPPTAHAEGPIAPEDAFSLDTASGLASDARGTHIAYLRGRWQQGEPKPGKELWVLDTRRHTSQRRTFTDGSVRHPTFTPDGGSLLVMAEDADGDVQLHRIGRDEGPLKPLTQIPDGIASYRLDPSGQAAWLLTHDDAPVDDPWADLRKAHDDAQYTDRTRTTSTLHRLDLDTYRVQAVWSPDAYIVDFAVTEGSDHIAAITAPDKALITWEGQTAVQIRAHDTGDVVTLPDTLWRRDAPSPFGWLSSLEWASDGRALAFQVSFDGYPGEVFVAERVEGVYTPRRLDRPREIHVSGPGLRWVPGTRELCMAADERARRRIVCVDKIRGDRTGTVRTVPSGDVVVDDFTFSADGRDLYAVVGTPERFPEVYRLPARGNLGAMALTDLNPHTESWALPTLSTVSWRAPDDAEVHGVLELPAGWQPADGPLPTVVLIHGGPTSQSRLHRSFRYHGRTLLASQGYAVLLPNYRGSTGYGDDFLTQLIGREADVDAADILAGVEHLVAEGVADPDRLAVSGWSNGGYLTNVLIGQTPRFKAAISGAGVADQAMQWALEDTPGHVINYMQGLPWQTPDAYDAASPIRHLARVRTPTLLHVGSDDARVPPAHARAMFRALDTYLDVPAELVVYPGASHGLSTRAHRLTRMTWDLAWLSRWLDHDPRPDSTDESQAGQGETAEP